MNHIYKVIFCKATGTFVAVAEFARAHGKKGSGTVGSVASSESGRAATSRYAMGLSGLTTLSAAIFLSLGLSSTAFAVVGDAICVADSGNPTTASSTPLGKGLYNNGTSEVACGADASASGTYAIAIGNVATASGVKSVATGYKAKASANGAVAIGEEVEGSGVNAVAIGAGRINTQGTTDTKDDVYEKTIASGLEAIAIGSAATGAGSESIAIGKKASTKVADGDEQIAQGIAIGASTLVTGTQGIALGNDAQTKGDQAVGIGANTRASGNSSIAIGGDDINKIAANSTSQTKYINIVGTALIPGSDTVPYTKTESSGAGSIAVGVQSVASGDFATTVGLRSSATGDASVALGLEANSKDKGTVAIGAVSKAEKAGAIAVGLKSAASDERALAVGNEAIASGRESVALGSVARETNGTKIAETKASALRTTAIGSASQSTTDYSTSLGYNSRAGGDGTDATIQAATAIGVGTRADTSRSVAIGAGALADRKQTATTINDKATIASGAANGVYALTTASNADKTAITNTVKGSAGVFSVGKVDETRQITNVAAGSVDSDAVNVAQLKSVANTPLTLTGNVLSDTGADGSQQKLGSTLNISGGATGASRNANVKTVVTDGKVDIQLLDAPTFAGKVSAQGFDAGSQKITNVAKGTDPNDAVNFSQLAETELTSSVKAGNNTTVTSATTGNNTEYTVNAEKSTISEGTGITVTKGATADNTTDYNVKLSDATNTSLGKADTAVQTVTSNDPNLTAVKTGNNVAFDFADAPTFTGQVKAAGFDASNAKIVNVLAGTEGTDAANVAQVKAAKTKVAAGTNVTTVAETTGDDGESVYTVNADKSTVSKGSDAVTVTAGDKDGSNVTDYQVDLSAATKTSLGKADSAVQTVTSSNDNLTATRTGNDISFDFADAPTFNGQVKANGFDANNAKIVNVDNGTVAANSKDAVNGDQLFTTNQSIKAAQDQANLGFNIGADNGTDDNVQLGETVNFTNTDKNLVATVSNNGINYDLADDINVKSVTATDGAKVSKLTATGTNVTDGTNVSNYGATGSTITDGNGNETVVAANGTRVTDGINTSNYGAEGLTFLDTNGSVLTNTPSITKAGINAGNTQITNVAPGIVAAGSKDAINGDQLFGTNSKVAQALGTTVDANGQLNAPSYTIIDPKTGSQTSTSVKEAFGDINSAINRPVGFAGDSGDNVTRKLGETLTVKGGANTNNLSKDNIGVVANGDNALSVQLAKDLTGLNSAQFIDKNGNQAVISASGTQVTDGTNTSNYGAAGSTVTDGTSTTTTGPEGVTVSNGTDTSTIGTDSITAGGANPVVVNGKDGIITGLTNTTYDKAQVVRDRAATEGQVSDVANSLGDLADTPLTFTGNSGSTAQKLGSTLNISGGATAASSNANVKTVVTDGKVDIQLLDAPTFAGQVKANGFDANNQKIVNVQDGSDAKDAVNKGQLDALATAGNTKTDALGNSTASNLGGGATYDDKTGTVSAPTYKVNGNDSNNVGDAISALDQGFTLQTNGKNAAAVKAGDTIDIGTADAENNLEVVKSANTIKYSLKKNLDLGATGSVTTGNTVTNNAGVTVDDKAGNVAKMTAAGTKVTDGTNTTNYGAEGLTFLDKNGAPITNAPSITKTGISAGNQKITNVAPGSVAAGSTDAINGDQLLGVKDSLTNSGLQFSGDNGTVFTRKLGEELKVRGGAAEATLTDNNIGVVSNDTNTLTVKLNKDINLGATGSVTTGNTVTNNAGVTVDDKAGNVTKMTTAGTQVKDNQGNATNYGAEGLTFLDKNGAPITNAPSITKAGIDAGSKKITNVAPGSVAAGSTDAINGDQLNTTNEAVNAAQGEVNKGINFGDGATSNNYKLGNTINVKGDSNVTSVTTADGVQLGLADQISVQQVTVGDATNSTVLTSTANGLDVGGDKITNVADGTATKDAVNKGQLDALATAGSTKTDALGNSTASNLGGGATYDDKTGTVSAPTYSVNGTNSNNVGDAISALDQGFTLQTNGADGAAVKAGDTIDIGTAAGENNLEVVKSANTIKYSLKKNLDLGATGSVTTGNTVTNNAGVTVDDKAGNVTKMTAAGTKVTDGTNTTNYGAEGLTFLDKTGNELANTPSITKTGISAGNQKITNVAPGSVAAGSTDAINGDQLLGVKDSLTNSGLQFSGDNGTVFTRKLGEELKVRGGAAEATLTDNNIGVVSNDTNTLTVKLNKDINLGATGSVTTGNTVTNNAGVTVDDKAGNVTKMTTAGTQVKDNQGNASNYGANGSSIKDAAGNQIITAADGSTVSDKAGNKTTTAANGVMVSDKTGAGTRYGSEGLTFLDTNGDPLANTPSITKAGISAGNTVIKNVAAGNVAKDSTDAINGNQLFETNQAIANAQGQANKGLNIAADNGTTDNVQLGETVKYTNKDSNLVATVSDNGINYDLADDINVKSVTADDGKGNVTKLESTGTKVKDAAGNNSSYNATGSTIVDTNGNTNASTAAGNTLTDDTGNETITAADGTNVKDAAGNASNYGAAGSKITDADGNETITAANGTKVKDANGNESVYGATGSTITDDAGNTNVTKATGNTIVDTAGNQTMTAANGMTVQDGKGNATSYGAEGLTFIDTTTGEAIAGTPSITKGGIDAGNTVIRNVASGLEGKTVEQIKAEGSTSTQWKNAATVGDLTQVQGNVTNVTNNVTNISQALGAKDGLVDDKGNLTQAGKDALITYNVAGQAEFINNSVIGAINKMNEEGIKFIHVNDETAGSEIPEQATNSIDSSAGGAYSTSIGYQAKVGNQATNGIAIGKGATVTGADSIAIGTGNVVTGTGSGAIGDPSTVTGDGSYSLGNDNTVATDNSFVIGNDVTKTAENSVNLGSKSAASTEASSSTAGTTVYNQSKINGETYNYAGGTAAGVVSVGDVDAERRIQNVAAGLISKDSTDAINGSQLYGTNQAIEALKTNIGTTTGNVSKGVNFGNGSAANNYQLGDTINVKGDKNVTSTTTTDGVQLGLADNITVKSVAAQTVTADDGKGNSATLTANGTSVKDAAGNTSNYGAAGNTVADKDGNKATTAANGVTVSNAKNGTVYGADGMTFVDKNGTAITKAPSVTVQGINAGNQQITNVAEGKITEGSNDAVNGGQLYNTNQAITKVANSVDDLGYKLDGVQEEANAGISSAMAMASMPQAFLPGKSMISGGIATYNGEGAVAVGMSKLSDNGRWVIKINGSADTKGNAGAAAGVGMHW